MVFQWETPGSIQGPKRNAAAQWAGVGRKQATDSNQSLEAAPAAAPEG